MAINSEWIMASAREECRTTIRIPQEIYLSLDSATGFEFETTVMRMNHCSPRQFWPADQRCDSSSTPFPAGDLTLGEIKSILNRVSLSAMWGLELAR